MSMIGNKVYKSVVFNRWNQSFVFKSGQKMALRAHYVVTCPQDLGHFWSKTFSAPSFGHYWKQQIEFAYSDQKIALRMFYFIDVHLTCGHITKWRAVSAIFWTPLKTTDLEPLLLSNFSKYLGNDNADCCLIILFDSEYNAVWCTFILFRFILGWKTDFLKVFVITDVMYKGNITTYCYSYNAQWSEGVTKPIKQYSKIGCFTRNI